MIDYEDERFKNVENDKQAALDNVNNVYNNMIDKTDSFYQSQIDASNKYAETQKELQQQGTDLAIEQINNAKADAEKDYIKEQKSAYSDYEKQADPYSVNAEAMAAQGMTNTGYNESSKVSMYNAYQNRVAVARDSYNKAVRDYDMAIKDAQLQNSSALAQIAYEALKTSLELSLEGFQYKNNLLQSQLNMQNQTEDRYYSRWQDVLNQMNTENSLAEQIRQYNESLAFQKEKAAQDQANWEKEYNLSKYKAYSSGSGSSGNGYEELVDGILTNSENNSDISKETYGNSEDTMKKSDYYFKSSNGKDYQPQYINNTKLSKTKLKNQILKLKDIGTIEGISGNKHIWMAEGKYYVWNKDNYVDITSMVQKYAAQL